MSPKSKSNGRPAIDGGGPGTEKALWETVSKGKEVHTVRVFSVERVDQNGSTVPPKAWQTLPVLLNVSRGDMAVFVLGDGGFPSVELKFPASLVKEPGPHTLTPDGPIAVTIRDDAFIGPTFHYRVRSKNIKDRKRIKEGEAHMEGYSTGGPGMKVDR